MQFITRAYNSIEFNEDLKTIIKKSEEERLRDEINYYKNLTPAASLYFPRIFRSKTDKAPFQMEMEFYSYNNLAHFYLNENRDQKFWDTVFQTLFSTISFFKKQRGTFDSSLIQKHCRSMFIDKTIQEFDSLRNKFEYFSGLSQYSHIYINGKKYKNFLLMWDSILPAINDLIKKQESFNVIHGDMCFSNILYGYTNDKNHTTVKFIDPRGSFGEKGIYGSSIYDYAKLLHSIDGNYEAFIYDKFTVTTDFNSFEIDFHINNQNYIFCNNSFKKLLSKDEYYYSKLIEGLIFIGMCARHYDSFERQKAMYLTGIRILNEVLDENMR